MRKALLGVVLGVLSLSACERLMREAYPPAYLKALNATRNVLARHYAITRFDPANGIVEASTFINANMYSKYRTRVEGRVVRLDDGHYDVQMRVINELEASEPSALGSSRPQAGYDWRAVGFDPVAEAILMAEVQGELSGRPGSVVPRISHVMSIQPPAAPMRHSDLFQQVPPQPVPPQTPSKAPEPPKPQSAAPERPASAQLFDQYMALGDQYLRRREHDRALLEYQRATLAQPGSPMPHLSLAGVWTALGRYSTGAEALRQAAAVGNGHRLAGPDLQRLRGLAEDVNQRLLLLKGWCKQNPGDRDARLLLGYHCLLAERPDEARTTLQEVLQATPKDPTAEFLLRQTDGHRS